jgi:hypothetical protein
MKPVALVSLCTFTGIVRRYLRAEGNVPDKTGEEAFSHWPSIRHREDEVAEQIRLFRRGELGAA